MAASDVLLKPAFVSPFLDGPDATKLQPSEWNAPRLFTGGVDGQILSRDAASATGATWIAAPAGTFAALTGKPTTLAGYGITDGVLTSDARLSDARVPLAHTQAFSTITGTPTTLAGYGIPAVTKADVGLAAVENTALSTWAGSANVVTVGTLANLTVTNPIVGSVTGSSGSTSGNAATATLAAAATVLQTARTINGVSFDGSGNITISAAAATLTGTALPAAIVSSSLTSVGTLAALTVTAPIVGSVTGSAGSATGNAATATALQTARAINGVTFDGTAAHSVTAAAGTVTGATLAATVLASSLTSVGTLASLTVAGGLVVGTTAAAPNGVEGYFVSTSASDPRGVMSAQYTTDAVGARVQLRKGRGTEAVPTILVTGDVLGRIRFSGYDGANYLQMASIDAVSTGTIAATRVPTYLAFSVATDAAPSVLTEALRLRTSGVLLPDGTSGAPAAAFASEPTLGVWRSGAGNVTLQGILNTTGVISSASSVAAAAAASFQLTSRATISAPAVGAVNLQNWAATVGAQFKVDALPTVTAGGGTSPAVTAGSTPLAGSVNVGSGSPGATITITFGGTAFPSAPFAVCMNVTTGLAVKATASTTTLVITPQTGNFGASDVIVWHCISSK
jgi:hypothetical protein